MYRVTVVTDGKEYPLLNKVLKLENPTLKEVVGNTPNYLKFSILPTHPHYDKINSLRSELFVYENGEELFRGRSVTGQESFNRTHQLTCESDLAYLCDSFVRPYEFKGSIMGFLQKVLDEHNAQVEERKRFQLGTVTVIDDNNYINRSNSYLSRTLDCLRDKLVQTHGGYLRTRLSEGIRYLDYVTDAGGINAQVIQYGVNLASYEKNRDATSLITALIPVGAQLEDGTTVDITSVNGGKDYVFDQNAVDAYGWIWGTKEWEDVTLPQNLMKKAKAYLEKSIYLSDVLQLTAVDLADMGVDIDRLKTGYWTRVKSKPHDLDVTYLLEERTRYLQEPGKGSISLGGRINTFSRSAGENDKALENYARRVASATSREIEEAVDNATQLITGGKGGYVILDVEDDAGERTLPWRILVMDSPDKAQAKNVIQINRAGIGFSNSGIGGPYRNAWTIDGRLVADFITTGTMYADRIRGGTLSLGGAGNVNGVLKLYDTNGKVIGQWDKDGIIALKGSFTGSITSSSATITGGSINIETAGNDYSIIHLHYQNAYSEMASGYVKVGDNSQASQMFAGSIQSPVVQGGKIYATEYGQINGNFKVFGDFEATGAKSRRVETNEHGSVLQYAYETAAPLFGDVGAGKTAEDGRCYIYLDDRFAATVTTAQEYAVFLQAEGPGSLWVAQKAPDYFVVQGTAGLDFAWEIKAKQKGYELDRLEAPKEADTAVEPDYDYAVGRYLEKYQATIPEHDDLYEEFLKEMEGSHD